MGHTGRLAVVIAAFLLGAFTLVACGGSDSQDSAGAGQESASAGQEDASAGGDSSGVAEAQANVDAAMEPITWKGPTDPVDISGLAGEEIWVIELASAVPYIHALALGVEEAAKEASITTQLFDARGDTLQVSKGISQAVSAGAKGVVLIADSATVAQTVAEAGSKGVTVVTLASNDIDSPPVEGEFGRATWSFYNAGALEADWAIADSDGKAHILQLTNTDYGSAIARGKGFADRVNEICPDCVVTEEKVQVANFEKQLPSITKAAVQSDPDLGYVEVSFDGMVFPVEAALRELSKTDVKIISSNAADANLDAMRAGGLQAFDVGTPATWAGWAGFDQLARGMAGQEPAEEYIPERGFTPDTLPAGNSETELYGDVDFRAEFRKLWGLE